MQIEYIKCHGSLNDFILIDDITHGYHLSEKQLVQLSIILCDRNAGIGADGILYLMGSDKGDVRMRIFNSDGSEPEMCGNGIRCLARKAFEITGKKSLSIETMKAVLDVQQEPQIFPGVFSDSVEIHNVSLEISALPLLLNGHTQILSQPITDLHPQLSFTALSLGNPHLVSYVKEVDRPLLEATGKLANSGLPSIPKGANISFFNMLGDKSLYVETFERGVGLTNSCGTAMSASSITSCLLGLNPFNEWLEIYNRGGMVRCKVMEKDGEYSVILMGNATFEYTASLKMDESLQNILKNEIVEENNIEKEAYKQLSLYCQEQITRLEQV